MAATRDSLDASASCMLPAVPSHWQHSCDLDHVCSAAQRAAGFSPRGSSPSATAGAQSRDREGAVPGMGVAPGVSPVSGIHSAGGIGGLLAVEAPQSEGDPLRHWYFYDGNGNVGQLLAYDATGPTVNSTPAAKYEYDPYGQLIQAAGTYAAANPFRFSTKWFDAETGLGYWGYRYYSPLLGRWMSRDPIGERGGLNLLLAFADNPIMVIDARGLTTIPGFYGECEPGDTRTVTTTSADFSKAKYGSSGLVLIREWSELSWHSGVFYRLYECRCTCKNVCVTTVTQQQRCRELLLVSVPHRPTSGYWENVGPPRSSRSVQSITFSNGEHLWQVPLQYGENLDPPEGGYPQIVKDGYGIWDDYTGQMRRLEKACEESCRSACGGSGK